MNDAMNTWRESTWRIITSLDVPDLDPETVQFAILDADPVERYRDSLTRNRETLRQSLADESDLDKRELMRQGQMTVTWDRLFSDVTGDRLYLLVPSRVKGSPLMMRGVFLSSNDTAGRKWLATKVAYRHQTPVCWCVPVETAIGREERVEVRSENTLDLKGLYDHFMADF